MQWNWNGTLNVFFFHSRIKTYADVFGLLLKERLPQLGHHLVNLQNNVVIIIAITTCIVVYSHSPFLELTVFARSHTALE